MYSEKVAPALKDKFEYSNPHQIPKIVKIVANMGLGEAVQNPKIIDIA
jgi:large subunit ribosomal protein L5